MASPMCFLKPLDLSLQISHSAPNRLLLQAMYSTGLANLFLSIEFSSQISLKRIEPVEQAFEVTDLLGFWLVRLQFPILQSVTCEHVGIDQIILA